MFFYFVIDDTSPILPRGFCFVLSVLKKVLLYNGLAIAFNIKYFLVIDRVEIGEFSGEFDFFALYGDSPEHCIILFFGLFRRVVNLTLRNIPTRAFSEWRKPTGRSPLRIVIERRLLLKPFSFEGTNHFFYYTTF